MTPLRHRDADSCDDPESYTRDLRDEFRAVEPDDPHWYKPQPDDYEERR